MYEPIDLGSAEFIRIPVKITGKWYAIEELGVEADGKLEEAVWATASAGIEVDPNDPEKVTFNPNKVDLASMGKQTDPVLISLSLRECDFDPVKMEFTRIGDFVKLEWVMTLPSRITKPLVARIKEISLLNKGAGEPNSPLSVSGSSV